MAPKPKYVEGEKVLCYHGPALYDAKITHVDLSEKEPQYHVHYQGWNKNWDEWITEERMVKHNESGLQKQRELKLKLTGKKQPAGTPGRKKGSKGVPKVAASAPPATPKVSTSGTKAAAPTAAAAPTVKEESVSRSSTPSIDRPSSKHKNTEQSVEGPRKKKVKVEPAPPPVETEDPIVPKVEVNIKLPDNLKPVLIDDWDFVNKQKMLFQLPAEKNIDDILNDYYEAKVSKDRDSRDTVLEITKGLRDYFNSMLGTQLLYKFERTQYGELLKEHKGKPLTDIYGSVHLLRLFVKVGSMLAHTAIDDRSMSVLVTHLQDFLRWTSKNASHLFSPTYYYSAPADYHRKAFL